MTDTPVASEPKSELDYLYEQIQFLETCGIVELAVRNPSVADYMQHWEARAEKAEAALSTSYRQGLEDAAKGMEIVAWRYRHVGYVDWSIVQGSWPEAWGEKSWEREPLYLARALKDNPNG